MTLQVAAGMSVRREAMAPSFALPMVQLFFRLAVALIVPLFRAYVLFRQQPHTSCRISSELQGALEYSREISLTNQAGYAQDMACLVSHGRPSVAHWGGQILV